MSKLKYIVGLGIVVLAGVVMLQTAKALPLYYTSQYSTGVASTTATLVKGGMSTTTKTFSSDGYGQVSWLVSLASSSTPPTLCWTNQYSINGTDWYSEDLTYASSTSHLTSEKQECWTYATTSATNLISRGPDGVTLYVGRRITVPNLGTPYTRTMFSINPGVYAMLDIRSVLKNTVVNQK